jgi:GTP-binding protein
MHRIAIVGRPNVGKSSLFNRLLGRRLSIVHDQPGVTRDRLSAVCEKGARPFEIIDTGGIGDAPDPDFAEATHAAAMVAMTSADLLLFVVDGRAGVTPLDRELAHQLRRAHRPLLLIVNKIDEKMHEPMVNDFYELGFEHVLSVSAAHGAGLHHLMTTIEEHLGQAEEQESLVQETAPKLAIVGRPNVGKSSLLNRLLGEERSIVSEIAGTTRDALDVECELQGTPYTLVDTAGLRHRSRPDTSVEIFSAMRSEEALRRADVGILVLDATAGVTAQDKRIAGLLQKSMKPCLIILNKWDLMHKEDGGRMAQSEEVKKIREELFFFDFAPIICLSAKTGHDVKRLATALEEVRQAAEVRIGTGELNRFFKHVWEHQSPPSLGGKRFKLLYATQVIPEVKRPFSPPEFLLFVNSADLMTDAYHKYLLHTLREEWSFVGLPIRLRLQGRLSREEQDRRSGGEGSTPLKKERPLKKNAKGNRLGG